MRAPHVVVFQGSSELTAMLPGSPPPAVGDLTRLSDRFGFLYLERCVVHRDGNAITATDERGTIHVPAAALAVLMLGPGTTVSQQAMVVLAESGSTAVWVGEKGVRYYAHGRTLSRSSRFLEAQARVVSHPRERIAVARKMYIKRFVGEDVSRLSMQQLRGREGARVRASYREHARRSGVEWKRRDYQPDDFGASDSINQAMSAAHTSLYGLVHAVVVGLGCAPGLGVVHTGHERSFVYDIADLYKAETSIPVAFDVVAAGAVDIGSATRRAMRDSMFEQRIIERAVKDIGELLSVDVEDDALKPDADVVYLWDATDERMAGGVNYSGSEQWS